MTERSQIFAPGLLDGKVCVVTGAGSGMGRASALELARLGATVVGCGRRPEPIEETKRMIERIGGTAGAEAMDIRDADAADATIERVLAGHGRIDVLVNNAGGQFLSPAEAITPKGFRTVIELNVMGTWHMTHAVATKAFIPNGVCKVISVTLLPQNGMPGMVHSGSARAAVENMMKTLSIEWSRHNVKLCAIAAGQFDTETMRTKYPSVVVENLANTIPLQRLGTEDEWAWLVAYLASPAGDFYSGTTITMDGARDNWFGAWPPGMYGGAPGEGTVPAEERKPKP